MDVDLRPRFYEGQFLGASDLSSIVDHDRIELARHALGAHTWGIAVGLTLDERPAPGGQDRVQVTLLPGFGWDGFGRPIAIGRPTRLTEDRFSSIAFDSVRDGPGGKGRLVQVWLAYDEAETQGAFSGFETCAADDQNARVGETFRFLVGPQTAIERQAKVRIGTNTVDAANALRQFDSSASDLFDASVPHQTFPLEGRPPRWLLPLGYVRWIARDQAVGYFAKGDLDPADTAAARTASFRHYAGVVAERIGAPDGAIVLAARGVDPAATHHRAELRARHPMPPDVDDLVWVEGNLRVLERLKLAGGPLLFLNDDGLPDGTPFELSRADTANEPLSPARELRAVIGEKGHGVNRLVVGPQDTTVNPPVPDPNLVVMSTGNVGIGTATPQTQLHVVGPTVRVQSSDQAKSIDLGVGGPVGLTSPTDSVTIQATAPQEANSRVLVNPSAGAGGGRVGIRTGSPSRDVDIKGAAIRLDVDGGGQVVAVPDGPDGIALEAGNGADNAPASVLRISGRAGLPVPVRIGGNVPVAAPVGGASLTIDAPDPNQGRLQAFVPGVADIAYDGGADNLFVFKHTGGGTTSFLDTNVGIGTAEPRDKLHVDGAFLRVEGSGHERANLGGDGNGDVQVGSANAAVELVTLWNTDSNNLMNLRARVVGYDLLAYHSDARLKRDVTQLEGGLKLIGDLRAVRFRWRADGPGGAVHIGVIAQEVERVIPQAVSDSKEGKGVDYTMLVPVLIEAVKELKSQVDDLRAEVRRLAKAPTPRTATRAAAKAAPKATPKAAAKA